ncbi:glucosaminidase domain-containing protein [Neobacillus sp. YIM B02564]|uniref:Glucosaminidase domain-containing protein n=1 Tax=Neobacillus paridis TaxID=2803862 RepID=A0ABS1TLH4_9BACI|nr:glucosaminidase domain-containing protein [Neobacillus paridis]MBL4952092.1 glucosaminidase domain-containing protein [Neobacillus paridis]
MLKEFLTTFLLFTSQPSVPTTGPVEITIPDQDFSNAVEYFIDQREQETIKKKMESETGRNLISDNMNKQPSVFAQVKVSFEKDQPAINAPIEPKPKPKQKPIQKDQSKTKTVKKTKTNKPVPKPKGDRTKRVHKQYNVKRISAVTASELNKVLGGKLKGHGADFVRTGKKYGIDPAFLAAISMHETGNGTSSAIRRLNNVGGIMTADGRKIRHFKSVAASIDSLGSLLKRRYLPIGKDTPAKIQPMYCPVGAKNDPGGLNKYWLNGVVHYWQKARSQM